jgi:hypothetical protein
MWTCQLIALPYLDLVTMAAMAPAPRRTPQHASKWISHRHPHSSGANLRYHITTSKHKRSPSPSTMHPSLRARFFKVNCCNRELLDGHRLEYKCLGNFSAQRQDELSATRLAISLITVSPHQPQHDDPRICPSRPHGRKK